MVTRTGSSSFAALAQEPAQPGDEGALSEITVTATRMHPKPMVSTSGWRRGTITQVSLSYAVSVADYDLTTKTGVADLEKAVRETAMDVCKQIGREYPGSTPDDAHCAKAASDAAMVQVRRVVAAARGNAAQ